MTAFFLATSAIATLLIAAGTEPPPGSESVSLATNQPCGWGFEIDLDRSISATLPTRLDPQRAFSVSDISGTVTISASMVNAMIALGGSSFDGSVNSWVLGVANAAPADFELADPPISIPNVTLVQGQPVVVRLPESGSLTAGPFTPDSSAGQVELRQGKFDAILRLRDSTGAVIIEPQLTCDRNNALLATAGIGSSSPARSGLGAPDTGRWTGSIRDTAVCVVGPLGPRSMPTMFTGTLPSYAAVGAPVYVTSVSSSITVPASVIDDLLALYPNAASGNTEVTKVTVYAGDNAISGPGNAEQIGPFTATSGLMLLRDSVDEGVITLYDAGGVEVGRVSVDCGPTKTILNQVLGQ